MKIPADVMARQLGDETVLLNLSSGMYFGLDTVGTLVWQLVGRGCELPEIVAAVVAEYDVSPERAEEDAQALIRKLIEQGLLIG